jgi:predicted nucleotidyltransferase
MDLGGLLTGLQEILHSPMDVATERMLRPGIRERALRESRSPVTARNGLGANALD